MDQTIKSQTNTKKKVVETTQTEFQIKMDQHME
jgi:hypothetical protein